MNLKFSCDMMLYDVARWLRFLGYDTEYARYKRRDKSRIYLTSNEKLNDVFLLKHGSLSEKLLTLEKEFRIIENARPFTRCSICNIQLEEATENDIDNLPPFVKENFNTFKKCPKCGRLYWKGSHYGKMIEFLKNLFPDLLNL